MLSLEQVKLLEQKVEQAIAKIKALSNERDSLKLKLVEKDKRISELENMVVSFKDDQARIESGIKSTLSLLDSLEDLATTAPAQSSRTAQSPQQHIKTPEDVQKQKDLNDILGKSATAASQTDDIF